jgi:gliding motility-associated-like protein
MQKIYQRFLFVLIFVCFYFQSYATHIVGGELYYHWLGNYNYLITLVVYRDCYNGIPPFDPIGCVGVFDVNNNVISYLNFPVSPDSVRLPPAINSPCFDAPLNICYEKAYYSDTIHLPLRAGGYQLAYQRCCRNNSISNIQNPGGTGITIYAKISGDSLLAINSNPVYDTIPPASPNASTLPPSFACLGVPFAFDNSAIDTDGDSLVYSLCDAYPGLTMVNPGPTCPDQPPYSIGSSIWQPPFSVANLLGGVPMAINSQTGFLTAVPNTVGQFVIAICVSEYRNGLFISTARRDYQLNVVPCPSLIVAALQTPIIHCGDSTVSFLNQSIGAVTYDWNFGDLTTLADTSHNVNPIYTYPDTGTYTVTLIAHSGIHPNCADTAVGTVHIYPPFIADFSNTDSLCSYKIFFSDTSTNNGSGITSIWNWHFGDAATSNLHNPSHNYPGPGSFNVTFIATSNLGCKDTVIKVITVDSLPSTTITISQPIQCHGDCNASATASPKGGILPYSFLWSTGETTQTATNLCAGTYTVTLTDSNSCAAIKTITINEPALLSSSVLSTDAYCGGKCIGTATVTLTGGTPGYTYTWSDPSSQQTQSASGLCPGNYTVLITDNHGCTKTDSLIVNYSNYIPPLNATVSDDTIYEGQTVQLASTIYINTVYTWTPPDFLTNTSISNPSATLNNQSVYVYVVEINDSLGCKNTDSVRIVVRKVLCDEPEIFIPNAFTPNNDGKNDILYVRGNTIKELLFRVYDRWGEKVFETTIAGTGWNGKYKDQPVQPGVYDYYLEATCFNNEKFFKKGNVTVIK